MRASRRLDDDRQQQAGQREVTQKVRGQLALETIFAE
jgi:hypothetical protein